MSPMRQQGSIRPCATYTASFNVAVGFGRGQQEKPPLRAAEQPLPSSAVRGSGAGRLAKDRACLPAAHPFPLSWHGAGRTRISVTVAAANCSPPMFRVVRLSAAW
jgi:hypothetical protein